ncbi:MAG: carboxypeptidase regulatory-like domain-containing protein [Deltaproteobacteria bacterium]|nr:MAG: carboxypeptidase regulatory-like domain-containing protein [Deltaproteobacteria bacterium]
MRERRFLPFLLTFLFLTFFACGGQEQEPTCVLGTAQGCEEGQVCEAVVGSKKVGCFAPIRITGRVFDLGDESLIQGATVVAIDADGAARSTVVVTDNKGNYSLPVFVPRDAEGNPQKELIRLRVDASGYQSFPTAPRVSLPIEVGTAKKFETAWEIQSLAREVALLVLKESANRAVIFGNVNASSIQNEAGGGVLIVAEQNNKAISTTLRDINGNFTLFNLPKGQLALKGFRSEGLQRRPQYQL